MWGGGETERRQGAAVTRRGRGRRSGRGGTASIHRENEARVHYDSCIYIRSKNIRALCRRAPPGISSENNILMYIRPLFLRLSPPPSSPPHPPLPPSPSRAPLSVSVSVPLATDLHASTATRVLPFSLFLPFFLFSFPSSPSSSSPSPFATPCTPFLSVTTLSVSR